MASKTVRSTAKALAHSEHHASVHHPYGHRHLPGDEAMTRGTQYSKGQQQELAVHEQARRSCTRRGKRKESSSEQGPGPEPDPRRKVKLISDPLPAHPPRATKKRTRG